MAAVLILILFFQGMPYVCKKEFFLPNIVIAAYRLLVPGSAFLVHRLNTHCCYTNCARNH